MNRQLSASQTDRQQLQIQASRTWALWRRLFPVSLALTGFYFALLCWWLIRPGTPLILPLLSGCTTILFAGCVVGIGRKWITIGSAKWCARIYAGVILLNSMAQAGLLHDPHAALGMSGLLVGGSLLFTDARSMALLIGLTLAGSLGIVLVQGHNIIWMEASVTLLSATVLAVLLYAHRMRVLEAQEKLRSSHRVL